MSTPDSFIEEVTEEVRRDRLFLLFRKYGWIGVLIVLATVGGAAYSEWTKAQATARAQAFGDAVSTALDQTTPEARQTALSAVPAEGEQLAVLNLLLSSDPVTDKAASLAALDKVIADASLPPVYHDLAVLRRVIIAGADMPLADRRAALDAIAVAGRPYRPLAVEQMAYLDLEAGDTEAALKRLRALTEDQDAPQGLRGRATQMIVVLGGETQAG